MLFNVRELSPGISSSGEILLAGMLTMLKLVRFDRVATERAIIYVYMDAKRINHFLSPFFLFR